MDAPSIMGSSFLMRDSSTFRGDIIAEIPKTSPILAMTLPNILPRAISQLFFKAASKLTAASGAELPRATTVTPMIIGRIRKDLANLDDPLTNHSDPKYRAVRPAKNSMILTNIGQVRLVHPLLAK